MSSELLIKNAHITNEAKRYLTAALCVLFAGCSQSGETTGEDKLDLKLKLPPGKTYVMRLLEEDKFSSGTQQQQTDLSHIKTTELGFDVKGVDDEDITSIKVTFRAMKEKTTNPRGSYEYDYTNPSVMEETPLTRVYHSMMGESFLIKVAPDGKVVEIDANDMFARTAEKIVEIEYKKKRSAEQNAEQRAARIEEVIESIKSYSLTSAEYLKELAGNIIPSYPDRAIRAGDSWTEKFKTSQWSPFAFEGEGTYTLKERKGELAVIEVNSKKTITDKPIPESGGQATYTGNVNVEGNLEINEATGWLVHKQVKMRLTGEMNDRGKTRPMSLESTVTVESVE